MEINNTYQILHDSFVRILNLRLSYDICIYSTDGRSVDTQIAVNHLSCWLSTQFDIIRFSLTIKIFLFVQPTVLLTETCLTV